MINDEIPVFDRRDTMPALSDDADSQQWQPCRSPPMRSVTAKLVSDGPSVTWRLDAQAARLTSNAYRGQADNDNFDWPLQKLLVTERNDRCLQLARRYRDLHDNATRPTQLIGKEADNLYIVHRTDEDGKSKGVKVVTGKKANVDRPARRIVMAGSETKTRAAAVPKNWNGDWPILSAIDAKRELAFLRSKLAFVPKILDAFEWAVCDNLTLAEIGERLGAGSKGGKGEARARIFDGFGIVDRYWQLGNVTEKSSVTSCLPWQEGVPLPAGFYRSKLQPDRIFPQAAA
ncbi:hypothetical protein [Neorhizobium alkalisoli]|uniref:Uncharacterized protein n=1 Tax=Neorhizobium alkalisoli TaxID=528178 RepID=A0A561QSE7_9HYPH|nr:hypothetical protein [Neorhizobium alkalisoli]TWF53311.1 hypothetical protein FHW37_104590 [Neorhizobium alkalisoli]